MGEIVKDTYLTIRFESPLKQRIETLAKIEKRTIANQAALLIEKGLLAFDAERESRGVVWRDRLPAEAGQGARAEAGTRAGKTA
jgi:hypothetical protein